MTTLTTTVLPRRRRNRRQPERTFSRQSKPDDLTLEQWQLELRRQFGREQNFDLENTGEHPVFSDFRITNPQSGSTYRVVIRGQKPGDNSCDCPDFATNALGTCKHVEFTLARLARRPGAKAALRGGHRPPYTEVVLRYGARREVRLLPGAECPSALRTIGAPYFGPDLSLRPDAYARFERFLAEAGRVEHEVRCANDALAFIAEVRDCEARRRRIDEAFPAGIRSPAFNKLLKADLYEYQRQGALFAARAGRSLIGDEMGLGKTIQAIAAAEIMARHLGVARVLIVCPTSLRHQWQREISRFTDRPACEIAGMRARRQELFAAEGFFKITSYEAVRRDLDLIRAWSPDLVILDEAQRIKNWSTQTARAVKRILSPFAIVLTGTPLENRLEELVSIVQFVDQHRLGPTYRFLADHQIHDDHGRVVGYRALDTIGKTLEPILIRRRKSEVLKQLPPRLDKIFFVPMTAEQMRHHEENRELVAAIVSRWRRFRFLSEADQRRLMVGLQNMRMSCNSTYLLDKTTDHGVKADELATLLDEIFERPGTKAVVFSQWVRTHELIERRLARREGRYGHVLFHGGVPGTRRKDLIDRFREDDACRAFLSTDAGGLGLNLQHASVVVNMDLPWNPAVLEQRIGRVHRLGQKQPVQVVNFVSQGTIEEGMLSVLKFKSSLFTGALDGGEKEVFLGGTRLTRFMETVEKTAAAIPATVPEEPITVGETENTPDAESTNSRDALDQAAVLTSAAPAPRSDDTWSELAKVGLSLLQQLAGAARSGPTDAAGTRGATVPAPGSLVRRDAATGESYLHLPVPRPEALERFLSAAGDLLSQLRR